MCNNRSPGFGDKFYLSLPYFSAKINHDLTNGKFSFIKRKFFKNITPFSGHRYLTRKHIAQIHRREKMRG